MTKSELEEQLREMTKEYDKGILFLLHIKKFIETNLQPFRDDIADLEDERNKGILAVLNKLTDIYNTHSNIGKIEPLDTDKGKVIKFNLIKGERK